MLSQIYVINRAKPKVCRHPQAFAIAVNNLVRNAFEHTHAGQGPITILIQERELLVTNRVSSEAHGRRKPMEVSSQGYGWGLFSGYVSATVGCFHCRLMRPMSPPGFRGDWGGKK